MAQKAKDPIQRAIEDQDVSSLRRLANAARDQTQRMWLQWLAEIIEVKVQREGRRQRDLRHKRRLPIVGIRPSRLS